MLGLYQFLIKNDSHWVHNSYKMPFYEGFEEDAYSDTSTEIADDDIDETDSLSVKLKYSIRHASIILRWLFKIQEG